MSLNRAWVIESLGRTSNDYQFELFVNELVSHIAGTPVVGTSRSWDTGKDGRSLHPSKAIFAFSTVQMTRVDAKFEGDASAFAATRIPAKYTLYLAMSTPQSEHFMNGLVESIGAKLTGATILPMSATQIADLCSRPGDHEKTFIKYFRNEYDTIRIHMEPSSGATSDNYVLALMAIDADGSEELRTSLLEFIILRILYDGRFRSVPELLSDSHAMFGAEYLSVGLLSRYVDVMVGKRLLSSAGSRFTISESGKERLAQRESTGAASAISIEESLRAEYNRSMGFSVSDDNWADLWSALRTGLATLLRAHSESMVRAINQMAENAETLRLGDSAMRTGLEALIKSAASSQPQPVREECENTLKAILSGRSEIARRSLQRFAAGYMTACTLGFEASVGDAIGEILRRMTLVLDTHVVLSLLCDHEIDHLAAASIFEAARRLGIRVLVPHIVAAEGAQHAAIATYDRDNVLGRSLKPLSEFEIFMEIRNSFARQFELERTKGNVTLDDWNSYIGPYAGKPRIIGKDTIPDIGNFRSLLADHGVETLPPLDKTHLDMVEYVRVELQTREQGHLSKEDRRKLKTDAEILVSIVPQTLRGIVDSKCPVLLVSSSRRLRHVGGKIVEFLGTDPNVMSLHGVAWMFSFAPNINVSVEALGTLICSSGLWQPLGKLEREFLKVLNASSSYRVPEAKRPVLVSRLRSALVEGARLSGITDVREYEDKALRDPTLFAELATSILEAGVVAQYNPTGELFQKIDELKAEIKRRYVEGKIKTTDSDVDE